MLYYKKITSIILFLENFYIIKIICKFSYTFTDCGICDLANALWGGAFLFLCQLKIKLFFVQRSKLILFFPYLTKIIN